jgi:hypothetical protein
MRIIAMMVAVTSCIIVLGSLVALFLQHPQATGMAGIGAGMVTFAEIGKAAQTFSEAKGGRDE